MRNFQLYTPPCTFRFKSSNLCCHKVYPTAFPKLPSADKNTRLRLQSLSSLISSTSSLINCAIMQPWVSTKTLDSMASRLLGSMEQRQVVFSRIVFTSPIYTSWLGLRKHQQSSRPSRDPKYLVGSRPWKQKEITLPIVFEPTLFSHLEK